MTGYCIELRDDWQDSTLGVAGSTQYDYADGATPPKYVWFRTFADSTTKQMAMINNEVDLLCEVTTGRVPDNERIE